MHGVTGCWWRLLWLLHPLLALRSCGAQPIYDPSAAPDALAYNGAAIGGPSQATLDQYAVIISENLLLKNGGDPVAAFHEGERLFNASQVLAAGIAAQAPDIAHFNIIRAIQNTSFYNITQMLGNQLASILPNQVGSSKDPLHPPDVFTFNYTQAILPSLIGATGLTYAPCLAFGGVAGAVLGAAGINYAPRVLSATPVGASALAQAINVNPAVLYIAQTGAGKVALGGNIAPTLISIGPVRHLDAKLGLNVAPDLLNVGLEPEHKPAPAPAPGPEGAPRRGSPAGVQAARREANRPVVDTAGDPAADPFG